MGGTPAHLICPGMPGIVGMGGRVSLASFMSRQSDGLWYDFTKTDRHFQENVGPTLADGAGEVIGLGLDQRQWGGQTLAQVVAAASEKVPTGNWTAISDAILSDQTDYGFRIQTGPADALAAAQKSASGFIVGRAYKFSVDATIAAADSLTIRVGSANISSVGDALNLTGIGAGNTTRYFTATATTQYFGLYVNRAAFSGDATISGFSIKEIPGHPAIQATGTLKPTWQTTGAKFDGTDDNLLTSYLAGAGANFIVALVTVPASLAGVQIITGLLGATDTRLFIGVGTDGVPVGGVGAHSTGTIVGGGDQRGNEVVIGISCNGNGNGERLFVGSAEAYSGTQSGSVSTTTPLRLGAYNNGGTAQLCFGGSIKKLVAGREFLTLSRYNQIRNALLTT